MKKHTFWFMASGEEMKILFHGTFSVQYLLGICIQDMHLFLTETKDWTSLLQKQFQTTLQQIVFIT